MTKDMLCVPVILSMRGELRNAFDKAWLYLSNNDTATIQYATKIQSTVAARAGDPDDLKINYKILKKILKMTSFSKYIEVGARFGLLGLLFIIYMYTIYIFIYLFVLFIYAYVYYTHPFTYILLYI